MKKVIVLFLALMILAVFVHAKTAVVGVVYEADKATPVIGANVDIKCYNGPIVPANLKGTQSTTTMEDGVYVAEFSETGAANCAKGYNVSVTAEKAGAIGTNTGIVKDYGVTVKLSIVNVSIPEFTAIGAMLAIAGSMIFILLKRKS